MKPGSENNLLWDRLEQVLAKHAPRILEELAPPAATTEINETERLLGVSLPQDVRAAYLRHNGSIRSAVLGPTLFFEARWCSLEEVVACWSQKLRRAEVVGEGDHDNGLLPTWGPSWAKRFTRPEYWNSRWIPIGLNDVDCPLCVDLAPAGAGRCGQLIYVGNEGDGGVVKAPGLSEYLSFIADCYESNRLSCDPDGRLIDTSSPDGGLPVGATLRFYSAWPPPR